MKILTALFVALILIWVAFIAVSFCKGRKLFTDSNQVALLSFRV